MYYLILFLTFFSISMHATPIDLLQDAQYKKFIDNFSKYLSELELLPLARQRELDRQFIVSQNTNYQPVKRTENLLVESDDGYKIPVKIYIPNDSKELPILIYFHPGGWVFGGIEESDAVCSRIANNLGCIVASVGYRLAPENPFPIPLNDCYKATEWIAKNGDKFGNKQKIIVCGESAGGNLAAAVAKIAHDKNGLKLAAQVLLYPVITSTIDDKTYDACPDRFFLSKETMTFFWQMYLPDPKVDTNHYASLDKAQRLSGLPPALIITAEYDPLKQEGEAYAKKLQAAKVPVVSKCFPKLIHAFLYISLYSEEQKVVWTKEIREKLVEMGILSNEL